MDMEDMISTIQSLYSLTNGKKYNTIYADPPWQFQNRTGKVAPEHKRLTRYETMTLDDIKSLPISDISAEKAHLYLWVLWMLGGSNIKEILYGKKSEKMGNLMAAVSVSISEM